MAKKKRNKSAVRQLLDPKRIAIPIVIGLGVATYFLLTGIDFSAFESVDFGWWSGFMLFCALIMVILRDLGYMLRLRILSGKSISWRNVFDDIMLWEFSSAVTPSVVGGSGVAIFILNKEDLSIGKSTAIVMTTAMLDELFYVVMVPILFLAVGGAELFPSNVGEIELLGKMWGVKEVFWIGFGFILLLISIIVFGIFISPQKLKSALSAIFSLPILKRWKKGALETGDEIVITSNELKGKPIGFWFAAFITTALSWTARYLVVNFLLMAFTGLSFADNLMILARQLIMWVIMLISPTPGGEGIAQLAFESFLADFTPLGLAAALAILWRLFTYYPYLFLGAVILPNWIQRVYLKRKLITFKS